MKEELEKLFEDMGFWKTGRIHIKWWLDEDGCRVDWTDEIETAITSIINLVDKEVIGSADEWDKKYPLSIKQDIKSRNNLRIEQRAKLKGVSNE